MKTLFSENTSETIKKYFSIIPKSIPNTTTQGLSILNDNNGSSKVKNKDDNLAPLSVKSFDRKHKSEIGNDESKNTESKQTDNSFEFTVIDKSKSKLSNKEDYSSYVTFKILNNCGKFDSLTLANWKSLTQIIIGNNCCTKCKTFCISFCPKLRSLLIGESSFSSTQLDIQGNHWHEYYIIDCASLEEITIDRYSFNNSRYLSLKSVWNYAAS